jgi:transposase InsO family protein
VRPALEDEILALRKSLADQGLDAGPHTIRYHLSRRHRKAVPSVATIWRVLKHRGFVNPQAHKRPRSSWRRFQAELPNECWQADTTHWALADGSDVEVLNILDDHSRLLVASRASRATKAAHVLEAFHQAASEAGFPASMLTDNGAIFTAESRHGRCVMENELAALGIAYKHSRPYHPQTCGKVERFHQTLKRWLAKQTRPRTVAQLQAQLDRFRRYYNTVRPHRALNRRTPLETFTARTKAHPDPAPNAVDGYRLRHDTIDRDGKVTVRYAGRLRHIGVGRRHAGKTVAMLVAGRDIRILDSTGEVIRQLTLDPSRDYQPQH